MPGNKHAPASGAPNVLPLQPMLPPSQPRGLHCLPWRLPSAACHRDEDGGTSAARRRTAGTVPVSPSPVAQARGLPSGPQRSPRALQPSWSRLLSRWNHYPRPSWHSSQATPVLESSNLSSSRCIGSLRSCITPDHSANLKFLRTKQIRSSPISR